jgi:hypothetical protein
VGASGSAPLLLSLLRLGLRSLYARPLLDPIVGLRKNRSGDQGNQCHSRKQLLHGIASWAVLWMHRTSVE